MSTFRDFIRWSNTFLIAVISLALAVAAAVCFVVVADVVAPSDIGPEGWFRDQFFELDALTGTDRAIAIASAAAAFAFALLLLVFESIPALIPSRLYGTDASGQTVMIDRRTIKQMIEKSATDMSEVAVAVSRIRDTGSGLAVHLKAGLVPDTNITEAGRKLEGKVKDDLRDLAGVSITTVRLELHYQPEPPHRETGEEHPTPA